MAANSKVSGLFGSIILIAVAVVIIARTSRDLSFYFNKTVTQVSTTADVEKLRDNMIAEISLPLDLKEAYSITYVSQREFVLIPFAGPGYKLMYVVEGPMSDKLIPKLIPPYKGRVVTKDFADSWDVYGKSMKLEKIFARDRITLPKDTMLVYDAPKQLPSAGGFLLLALAIAYLIYKALSLSRVLRGDSATTSPAPDSKETPQPAA